jgi:hypothetical protein
MATKYVSSAPAGGKMSRFDGAFLQITRKFGKQSAGQVTRKRHQRIAKLSHSAMTLSTVHYNEVFHADRFS